MAASRSDMFPDVVTRNIIKGKCSGECGYCYMRHGRLATIETYHKPYHLVESELKKKFKPDTVYFLGSATDMWTPEVHTGDLTSVMRRLHDADVSDSTVFLFSTKYPDMYHGWLDTFPKNTILSFTLETDIDIDYRNVSQARLPAERIVSGVSLRRRIDENYPTMKLMMNMEPALNFHLEGMLQALREIRPDLLVIGADTSGWCKKNDILQASWTEIIGLLECARSSIGQILIKKNIWNLAPSSSRGVFMKLMREHAEAMDFAIQRDPTCHKQQFFLGENGANDE